MESIKHFKLRPKMLDLLVKGFKIRHLSAVQVRTARFFSSLTYSWASKPVIYGDFAAISVALEF